MFANRKFVVISPHPTSPAVSKDDVTNHGAASFTSVAKTKPFLDADPNERPDYIISDTSEFSDYAKAQQFMIPVVKPQWVHDSIAANKLVATNAYSPDDRLIFKDVYACVADTVPQGDKEVLYGAIVAFGGQYNDIMTRATTHLISPDATNEKYLLAASSRDDEDINIKPVSPHWINRCVTSQSLVDETDYLVSPTSNGIPEDEPMADVFDFPSSHDAADTPPLADLEGKRFFVSSDFNLSSQQEAAVTRLIHYHGGIVSPQYNPDTVDIYLGKFRSGDDYERAKLSPRTIVANLDWLYHIVQRHSFVLPRNANMLFYPFPNPTSKLPLEGMSISLTNYSGNARFYLIKLIEALGATFTKNLTRDNDILVSSSDSGKKYSTAKFKWLSGVGDPVVSVVNHLWLEECYRQQKQVVFSEKYTIVGSNQLPPPGLARLLPELFDGVSSTSLSPEKDEIGSEPEAEELHPPKDTPTQPQAVSEATQLSETSPEPTPSKSSDAADVAVVSPKPKSQEKPPKSSPYKSQTKSSPQSTQASEAMPPPTSRGRSAARKAAEKLHNDMSDLNQFEAARTSKRKMKDYLETHGLSQEQAEQAAAHTKRKRAETNKSNGHEGSVPVRAKCVVTGFREFSRAELSSLSEVGIVVVGNKSGSIDFDGVDTLSAPKVMRTEKFLRGLGHVKRLIHPSFFDDVLKSMASYEAIDNYSLDKKVGAAELNSELGGDIDPKHPIATLISRRPRDGVFAGTSLNLSHNLNGGVDLIARVLHDHGMEAHQVAKGASVKSPCQFRKTGNDPDVVYICHASKDQKLVKAIKAKIDAGNNWAVVEWDWCVQCIFHMQMLPLDGFSLV
ncbi:hypothetical protein DIURU_002606 [Diutina rugosa]|uniref:BRCT domain-containing protein n=1 Tax=Diutina rugosa TaxID=5481 RepID=A0A642UU87_DIURU|nr:uncharacterized protein DIURU_002606 [Diutina rugosa]KAA8903005.1 hypothetical protein DIURU_002606 [Diutina rugosa]